MGGPLSRLLADLIIENKLEKVIQNHPKWERILDWVRLIDDTLSVWRSKEVFLKFFEYLILFTTGSNGQTKLQRRTV